ncbi:hypothetical protein Areg01_22960 [Actinoplanes regularis]|nr:hypothetical protein Areg01_22960 [Actinoplanes regularis]
MVTVCVWSCAATCADHRGAGGIRCPSVADQGALGLLAPRRLEAPNLPVTGGSIRVDRSGRFPGASDSVWGPHGEQGNIVFVVVAGEIPVKLVE